MKLIAPNQAIPTHIISGFLGAGKTTLLQYLLKQKPKNEVWAVLMNEFGQIGIDQQILPHSEGYAVQELLGGCLCCSSQFPMQIALSRLLSDNQIDRLFIEPTGLGHPAQLLEQLTELHWLQHLSMRSLVTVVDGSRLHDATWTQQNLYQDQLKAAQVIVISHADIMSSSDQEALQVLQNEYQVYGQNWLLSQKDDIQLSQIDQMYKGSPRRIQPLLKVQKQLVPEHEPIVVQQLPYHYVEQAQGYSATGWKFPKRWQFDFMSLFDLFCEQQNFLRIKAIFNTNQGWKTFNFNPEQYNYQSTEEGIDNRIEIIYSTERDWSEFEAQLLACQQETI